MRIRLEVYGSLRDRVKDRLPDGKGPVEVPEGATVDQVAELLQVDLAANCVIMVNGVIERQRDRSLAPDAIVTIIPPVAGGRPCTAGPDESCG